jgi:Tfp pilus assembly protein PilN
MYIKVQKSNKCIIFWNNKKKTEESKVVPKCLGIYIEDDVIKYAKVDKNKDLLKVESSSVVFYEKENIVQTLEKIIRETFSAKDAISINVSNELYNYFDVFSALKPADRKKSVDLDFELLCSEKGYNKDSLDSRTIYRDSKENADKIKAIHIAANKENIRKRIQDFGMARIVSATPIPTSIYNLIEQGQDNSNIVIVNIEKDTKVTTVLNGEIYNIDIIPEGMGEILNSINNVENSMKKSYECCKNTTIYTQDMQDLQTEENDHLEDIMPVLYKIVTQAKAIAESAVGQISKLYITGLGTAINNVDLYFQEYIPNIKCELLRPFFLENASIKIPIKDYIEVNSAIALALEGLGYGESGLNFKSKGSLNLNASLGKFDVKSIEVFLKGVLDPKKPLTALDKTLLRVLVIVLVFVIGYSGFSMSISKQITEKQEAVASASQKVDAQISTINEQNSKITTGTKNYDQVVTALTTVEEPTTSTSSDYTTTEEEVVITKYAIPNLLNRIVQTIPQQVKITSIKNTTSNHIVIEAQASKYDQLGYFRAVIATDGILDNVKSTSGLKSGSTVTITIEGDLP